jgi:uncharacterized membrane protein YeaQ/YmgE (transglycosylase-associated protein family)
VPLVLSCYCKNIRQGTKQVKHSGAKEMGGIIAWIVLGLIAGAIAKAIYPGHQGGGFLATTGLGILGALVGGYLGNTFFGTSGGAAVGAISLSSIAFAVLGAIVLLFIWGLLTQRAA